MENTIRAGNVTPTMDISRFHRPQRFHDKPYLQTITSDQRNTRQDSMTRTIVDTSKMGEWRYEQSKSETQE